MQLQQHVGFGVGVASTAACALLLALAGCNGGTSSPAAAASPLPTMAGDYSGTVTDSVSGAGTAAITIAQSAASVGGNLVFTYPGAGNQTFSVAATVAASDAITGSAVATIGAATCGFNVSGTYDTTNFTFNGTYTAFSGCSGRSGTFALTEQCSNPAAADRRRAMMSPTAC